MRFLRTFFALMAMATCAMAATSPDLVVKVSTNSVVGPNGAINISGSTTAGIQEALNARLGPVQLGAGIFNVSTPISPGVNQVFIGSGPGTVIKWMGNSTSVTNCIELADNCYVGKLLVSYGVVASGKFQSAIGCVSSGHGATNFIIEDLTVTNADTDIIYAPSAIFKGVFVRPNFQSAWDSCVLQAGSGLVDFINPKLVSKGPSAGGARTMRQFSGGAVRVYGGSITISGGLSSSVAFSSVGAGSVMQGTIITSDATKDIASGSTMIISGGNYDPARWDADCYVTVAGLPTYMRKDTDMPIWVSPSTSFFNTNYSDFDTWTGLEWRQSFTPSRFVRGGSNVWQFSFGVMNTNVINALGSDSSSVNGRYILSNVVTGIYFYTNTVSGYVLTRDPQLIESHSAGPYNIYTDATMGTQVADVGTQISIIDDLYGISGPWEGTHAPGFAYFGDRTTAAEICTNVWYLPTIKSDVVTATNGLYLKTNTAPPAATTGLGLLWCSNKVLYFITDTKTNLVSNGF